MDSLEIVEVYHASIDSTQLYARGYIDNYEPINPVVIRADEQTAGIGQYERKWVSPPGGNIYATFIFPMKQEKHSSIIPYLSMIASCSISQSIEEFNFNTQIKWVNDIMIDSKKVSGCLTESISQGEVLYSLIGIGINVNTEASYFTNIDQAATSLKEEKGEEVNRDDLFEILKKRLLENFTDFFRDGINSIIEYYDSKLLYKGEKVKIITKTEEKKGILKQVNKYGNIILSQNGSETTIIDGRLYKDSDS